MLQVFLGSWGLQPDCPAVLLRSVYWHFFQWMLPRHRFRDDRTLGWLDCAALIATLPHIVSGNSPAGCCTLQQSTPLKLDEVGTHGHDWPATGGIIGTTVTDVTLAIGIPVLAEHLRLQISHSCCVHSLVHKLVLRLCVQKSLLQVACFHSLCDTVNDSLCCSRVCPCPCLRVCPCRIVTCLAELSQCRPPACLLLKLGRRQCLIAALAFMLAAQLSSATILNHAQWHMQAGTVAQQVLKRSFTWLFIFSRGLR